jgi:hypothetical protein
MGSKPVPDPSKYPGASEVRTLWESNRAALIKWLETAPDSALQVPLSEKTGGFATDPLDAFCKLCWHEGWHFGQVASVRKSLGLPNALG